MTVVTRTKKTTIILGILVLVAGGGLYGLYWMIQQNIKKAIGFETMIQERGAMIENTKALVQYVQDVGPDIDKLSSRIVSEDGVAQFIESIEVRGKALGLTIEIQSAEEQDHPTAKEYQFLALSLRTQGSWAGTHQFISFLENLPYKLSLTDISIHGQPEARSTSGSSPRSSSRWTGMYSLQVLKMK